MDIITTIIRWHISFFLYLILAILGGLIGEVFLILIFMFLHELGHFFFLKLFNYPIKSIDVYPFGMIISFNEHQNDFLYRKLLISAGGVLVNAILAILLIPFKKLAMINLLIILINTLPLFPLDGGRIFEAIIEYIIPYKLAKRVVIVVGLILSLFVLFTVLCFYQRVYLLLIILVILKYNFTHYNFLHDDWILFTTTKYLYPNQKLKTKKQKGSSKHPVETIYAGKNNIWDYGSYQINERIVLKKYIAQKTK